MEKHARGEVRPPRKPAGARERERERQTERKADRQTDRTEGERERERERERDGTERCACGNRARAHSPPAPPPAAGSPSRVIKDAELERL